MAISAKEAAGGLGHRTSQVVDHSLRLCVLVLWIAWLVIPATGAEPPGSCEGLVVRLIHPERQAAAILSLFEGARVPHPAAALAAWKRVSDQPDQLGKPLEAAIAFFNPEMAAEWRVFHQAELHFSLDPVGGRSRWYAVVPRDDGTVAAAITALRLTDGADEPPIADESHGLAVERLGRPGSALAARVEHALVLASDRDDLVQGIRRMRPVAKANGDVQSGIDSGLIFELDPARLDVGKAGSLWIRRGVELMRGLGCRRLRGALALQGDRLGLEVTTSLDGAARPVQAGRPVAAIDPAWLEWIPSARVMGTFSLALDPSAAFWDSAFALADRIERLDPARAAVAPLRARINLLAASAGVRPETNLWPHLRGLTVAFMGDPNQPGRLAGLLLVLHTDTEPSAERLANEFTPRPGVLLAGGKRGDVPVPGAKAAARESRRLGKLGGRSLTVWRRDRNVLVAWTDDALVDFLQNDAKPDRSVATYCQARAREVRGAPQRISLIWPARCLPSFHGLDPATPALRVLADDPPIIWRGWSEAAIAHDAIEFSELKPRIRRFLDQVQRNIPD